MKFSLLSIATLTLTAVSARAGDLVAIKVGHAETVSHGRIDHAVILIEDGKIVTIGADLPIERGIPVLDLSKWWVMPGLVNPYSRLGLEARSGAEFNPQMKAEAELFPRSEDYARVLECGVTTLGLYPAGAGGVAGQAAAIKPSGATKEEMLLRSGAYLLFVYRSDARNKKMIRDAFDKADEYAEKEKKAREKWDKDQESKKKKTDDKKTDEKKGEEKKDEKKEEKKEDKSAAQDEDAAADEKKEDKKDEKKEDKYVPSEPDEKTKAFVDLRAGKLRGLVTIQQSADWLHFQDAIEGETFEFDLRIPLVREIDVFEISKQIGEKKLRVLMEPELTLTPATMRQRNLPAEFVQAGAKLVLLPRGDTIDVLFAFGSTAPSAQPPYKSWLRDVARMVAAGLDRDVALRAVTLEPAHVLGLEQRIGSLEKGKDANLLFINGDPFEAGTQIQAVMLDGRIVHGEVQQ